MYIRHMCACVNTFLGRPTLRAAPLKGMPSRLSAAVASSAVLISRKAKRAFMRMDTIGLGGLQSPTWTSAPPRYSFSTGVGYSFDRMGKKSKPSA